MNNFLNISTKKTYQPIIKFLKSLTWIDIAMMFFFSSRLFTAFFTFLIGSKGIFLTMGILSIIYLMAIIQAWKEDKKDSLFIFFFIIFIVTLLSLITMLFNPEAKEWMMSFDYGIITRIFDVRKGVFGLFVILIVKDRNKIFNNLSVSSLLMFTYLIFQGLIFMITDSWEHYFMLEGGGSTVQYNMSYGYEMIFVSIVFFSLAIIKNKKTYIGLGIISFIFTFILGSRGAILPLLVFFSLIIVKILWKNRKKVKTSLRTVVIFAVVFIAISGLIYLQIKQVSNTQIVDGNVEKESFRTGIRNIDMLFSNEFADDNGRVKIWRLALWGISEKFPLGYGVYGDRPFVGQEFHWGYSHNIFLELIISFGMVGVLFILFLLHIVFKSLFSEKYNEYSILSLIFISMSSKLLISDSFWYYDFFWAMIGVFIIQELNVLRYKQNNKLYNFMKSKKFFQQIIIVLSLIIVANIVFIFLNLSKQIKNQEYKSITIEKPTALLMLQDMDEEGIEIVLNEIYNRDIKASVFIDVTEMKKTQIKELNKIDNLDIQLELKDRSLGKNDIDEIREYIDYGKKVFKTLDNNSHLSISTKKDRIYPNTLQFLRNETDALFLKKLRFGDYYYETVDQKDIYKLNAMDSSINNYNYEDRMPYLKNQIDLAYNNESLIILYFKNVKSQISYDEVEDNYTYEIYMRELLEYLEDYNFEFISTSELLDKAYISDDERSFKSIIFNSELFKKLF